MIVSSAWNPQLIPKESLVSLEASLRVSDCRVSQYYALFFFVLQKMQPYDAPPKIESDRPKENMFLSIFNDINRSQLILKAFVSLINTDSILYCQIQTTNKINKMNGIFVQLYPLQSILKLAFLPMSLFNMSYTTILAVVISIIALLRMLKTPKLNKTYLAQVIQNNHGQNLLYICMGFVGGVNFLFYSPLALYFAYGLVEYINQKWSNTAIAPKYMPYVTAIRNQKFYIMQGKGKLQIVYFIFCILLIPISFSLMHLAKIFMLGQFLMTKYRINTQFKHSVIAIDKFFDDNTKSIAIINKAWHKVRELADKLMKMTEPQPPAAN